MSTTTNHNRDNKDPAALAALLQELGRSEANLAEVVRFSDLDRATARPLTREWHRLPTEVRRSLVRRMSDLAQSSVELNFSRMLLIALDDSDPEVRALAIAGLWEDESLSLLDRLLSALSHERETAVREELVRSLGRYCYLASLGDLDEDRADQIRGSLLDIVDSDEDIGIRRLAVESLSYWSDEPEVEAVIVDAYESPVASMQSSALTAMGRNLNPRWLPLVQRELSSDEPDVRLEATRAAGEFAEPRLTDDLVDLLTDEEREVQLAAIYSLGQIGSRTAREALRRVARSDDAGLRDYARQALALSDSDIEDPPLLSR